MVRQLVNSVLLGNFFRRTVTPGLRFYYDEAEGSIEGGIIKGRREELQRFIDSLRIHVKGGIGGDGFPKCGGVGGKGGDVIVVGAETDGTTLKSVRQHSRNQRYEGLNGEKAKLFCIFGANGKSLKIPVPLGISVMNDLGQSLGEVNKPGDEVVVAKGGEGGGPTNGYSGQKGQSLSVTLDLKLIADVGFVGFPNAGKSTLLKAISRATPRIASYPFTTVRPNIGMVMYEDFRQIALADLPGLIEGAHLNYGMGYKFLKHVERTKLLLFVVDLFGFQLSPKHPHRSALETVCLLNKELELYQSDLTLKPSLLVLNKTDLPGALPHVEKTRDTLFSDELYEEYVMTLPEEHRPKHPIKFDKIIPISAAKNRSSVLNLKEIIRTYIDVNEELALAQKDVTHA